MVRREKKGKTEIQKSEYFEIEKSFLDEIENIFDNGLRAISWSKKEKQQMQVIISEDEKQRLAEYSKKYYKMRKSTLILLVSCAAEDTSKMGSFLLRKYKKFVSFWKIVFQASIRNVLFGKLFYLVIARIFFR